MEPKRNYDREMERVIEGLGGDDRPRLLLHACCAPCSSAVLERLTPHFAVTLFYYNPNIAPRAEYDRRLGELRRFVAARGLENEVAFLASPYEGERFFEVARGLEDAPEGGARCEKCFRLRLTQTAQAAKAGGFDFFTTTLTVSPLKNAALLNRLGEEIGEAQGVPFLPSDFKKRDGHLRSLVLSREYNLYRQDYCGCVFSRAERDRKKQKEETAHDRA